MILLLMGDRFLLKTNVSLLVGKFFRAKDPIPIGTGKYMT
jgi:hypothetical protein